MGCSIATPPIRTNNGVQPSDVNESKSDDIKTGQNLKGESECEEESNIEDNVKVREFYSFESFVLKNHNPTIFDWMFLHEIGKGSKSNIFLAQNTQTGQKCAAKVYNKSFLMRVNIGSDETAMNSIQHEIEIMAAITHKNSVPLVEIIEDDMSNSLIMLTPYAKHGNLQSMIESSTLNEKRLAICFYQIAEALNYIHSLQIVHRNIKPQNILAFSKTFYCISNFSDSDVLNSSDKKLNNIKGTPEFLSPEEMSGKSFFPKPADVWSYGVSFYFAAFKKLPFGLSAFKSDSNDEDYISQIYSILVKEKLDFSDDASEALKDLLTMILVKDFKKRPTFEKILEHSYFDDARNYSKSEKDQENENQDDQNDFDNNEE